MNNKLQKILNRLNQALAVTKFNCMDIDGDCPCVGPVNTPRPVPFTPEWGEEQMKCCKCLIYGESKCKTTNCTLCDAWVMRNRRKNPQSSNWSSTPCGQALNKPQWNGGWPSPACCNETPRPSDCGGCKFQDCWCGTADTGNPSVAKCLKSAESICRQVGGGYFDPSDPTVPNPSDPTGGANFYHRCDLDNEYTRAMDCSVAAGICTKVTTGSCAGCEHCYFKCNGLPQPCPSEPKETVITLVEKDTEVLEHRL